jgi:hypothetical protein
VPVSNALPGSEEAASALARLFAALVSGLFPADEAGWRLGWVAGGLMVLGVGHLVFGYPEPLVRRGTEILFAEAKKQRKDSLQRSQGGWLEAALDEGVPPSSFLIVEWDSRERCDYEGRGRGQRCFAAIVQSVGP